MYIISVKYVAICRVCRSRCAVLQMQLYCTAGALHGPSLCLSFDLCLDVVASLPGGQHFIVTQ